MGNTHNGSDHPKTTYKQPPRRRVLTILSRLRMSYGTPIVRPHGNAIGELILTVLSQSTNDINRDVAFNRLEQQFHDWTAIRNAPVDQIEQAIRPGGISKVKSARIQNILRALGDPPSLDQISTLPVEEARDYLCSLPGVGRKTAACVLLFSFGMRDVPVDTHVGRVGVRLNLLPERGSSDHIHDLMLALTPAGAELELHLNLLRHGRRICSLQRPRCYQCVLRRICPTGRTFIQSGLARAATE